MQVTLNGKLQNLNQKLSLLELLKEKKLDKQRVVVELNLKIIAQKDLGNTIIQEGDAIEIIKFMGGG